MRTIDWYMDTARARADIHSDNKLAARIGISGSGINQFRSKRAWPSDDTMIALAELAGVDPAQALMELNIWRAKSPKVAQTYEAMRAKLAAVAASLIVMIGLASPAHAAPIGADQGYALCDQSPWRARATLASSLMLSPIPFDPSVAAGSGLESVPWPSLASLPGPRVCFCGSSTSRRACVTARGNRPPFPRACETE
jgi:hypothetical protein